MERIWGINFTNLFAYRDKNKKGLKNRVSNYDNKNIEYIKQAAEDLELIIVCWTRNVEENSDYKDTISKVKELLDKYQNVKCFMDSKGNKNCHLSIGYGKEWRLVDYFDN